MALRLTGRLDGWEQDWSDVAGQSLLAPTAVADPADIDVHGRRVTVRPVRATDAYAVRRFLEGLSPDSRYRRFHGPVPRVRAQHLAAIVDVDHRTAESLVAFDGPRQRIVGIAQFHRVAGFGDVADAAVMVADDWQGRGLGGCLVDRLATLAADAGITTLEASVQSTNRPAMGLVRHFPGRVEVIPAGTSQHLVLSLVGCGSVPAR
jgi:L-amino acid N-acyltransferase YncA